MLQTVVSRVRASPHFLSLVPLSLPFLPPTCHPPFPCQDYGLTKSYIFAAMMFVGPVLGTVAAGQANRLSVGTQVGWRWWLVGEAAHPRLPSSAVLLAGRLVQLLMQHLSPAVLTRRSWCARS